MVRSAPIVCLLLSIAVVSLGAQSPAAFTPTSAGFLSVATLGVPGAYGGLEFSSDGNFIYFGGEANTANAVIWRCAVMRNPVTRTVTGLGPPVFFASAPNIDGGLEFGPRGTLFFTTFPNNELGQVVGGVTTLTPLPVDTSSTGGLVWVPSGAKPLGSRLLVSSFGNGEIWDIGLTDNLNGTFTPTSAVSTGAFASEGMAYVPGGPGAGLLLGATFGSSFTVVDLANPTVTASIPTASIASMSITFDPITHDLFVLDFGGTIEHFTGVGAPTFELIASTSTISAATGGTVFFQLTVDPAPFVGFYALLPSISGAAPGTLIGSEIMPLNFDLVTEALIPILNTPGFADFIGTFAPGASALATMSVGPLPPPVIGIVLTFAAIEFDLGTTSAASNALNVRLVP